MADFKTKLIMLAGAATMFASMAFGQATFAAANPVTAPVGFIRSEGTTEVLPSTTVTITGAVVGSITLTDYLSPAVPITSRTSGSPAVSEITATANTGGVVTGIVSGSTVTFPAIPTTAATTSIVISNIRVNASTLAVSTGVPNSISELIFISGANATPGAASPVTVAYVFNGLGTTSIPAAGNPGAPIANLICSSVAAGTAQFTVNISENFSKSFKTQTEETNGSSIQATSGTRIALNFANVPAGVSVYVPLSINPPVTVPATTQTGVLTLITSPTAATSAGNTAVAAGTSAPLNTLGAVTIANGAGTAYYELTTPTASGLLENFAVPVTFASKAAVLTAPAGAVTVTVNFAPVGSTTNVPNFVVNGSTSTTPLNGSTYAACSTTLLFPFVTNQLGFDTGVAIANMSTDTLGTKTPFNSVTAQSGTCSMSFFGANAPASPVVTATVNTATTYAAAVSTLAPGFQGYMIANCNFQFAHGFAYVVYNLTQNNGAAMGYLALASGTRAVVGGVETLGN